MSEPVDSGTHSPGEGTQPDGELSACLVADLDRRGIAPRDEVGLRRELERHLPGYTLYRLLPAAAHRWKCRYRIMFGDTYFDCQTVAEAYARALLAALGSSTDKR